MSHTDRIIALIDMDCFYCQVEENLDPNLKGKPIAVVQYNQWRGGGIIAVNYVARDKGVTRQMRGDEAKKICPDIQLPRVPQVRGKADLTKYREAGKRVAEVLMSFTKVLERASIDEAYMDITEAVNVELKKGLPIISMEDLNNTYVVGVETADFLSNIYKNQNNGFCEDDLKLVIGGAIIEKVRAEVFRKTGYKCSAGIAHNKTLAKLVCSLHKPNKQTILPQGAVPEMFSNLPIRKIKNLGGKFGHTLSEMLKINYVGELVKFSEKELIQRFDEKNGRWLYNISRGIDREPVQLKFISKSIGCCKRFPGRTSLNTAGEVHHWARELSIEISERLEEDLKENNRRARLMTISFSQETNQSETSNSRATPLKSYEVDKICKDAMDILQKNCQKSDGSYHVTFLGISIGNFEDIKNVRSITSYFRKKESTKDKSTKESISSSESSTLETKAQSSNELKCKKELPDANPKNIATSVVCNSDEIEFASGSNFSELLERTNDHKEESNYSDSTVDLEENPDDYIFYDICCSRSIGPEPHNLDASNTFGEFMDTNSEIILHRSASSSSVNSLENEVNLNESPTSSSPVLQKQSISNGFFSNYFGDSQSPCKRNFDTSKMLENEGDSSLEEEVKPEVDIDFLKNCEECGEVILITEMVSHMDYHYALKLSRENSSLTKSQQIIKNTNEKTSKTTSKKRKAETKNSITSFFKKSDDDAVEEQFELCSQCNKNIKLSEIDVHSDYHAAKKLHLEMNNAATSSRDGRNKHCENKSNNHKNGPKNNIISFFKNCSE